MQALRIKIGGVDHLFFGPALRPEQGLDIEEIEDVGPLPMSSVSAMLDRVQSGEPLYGTVQ